VNDDIIKVYEVSKLVHSQFEFDTTYTNRDALRQFDPSTKLRVNGIRTKPFVVNFEQWVYRTAEGSSHERRFG
jgi:hypothetical protein